MTTAPVRVLRHSGLCGTRCSLDTGSTGFVLDVIIVDDDWRVSRSLSVVDSCFGRGRRFSALRGIARPSVVFHLDDR